MNFYKFSDKLSFLVCLLSLFLLFFNDNNGITLGMYISKNYYSYVCFILFFVSLYFSKFNNTLCSRISMFISKFMIYLYIIIFIIGSIIFISNFLRNSI